MLNNLNKEPLKPKRVVIVGKSGFVAKSLTQHLTEQAVKVEIIGSDSCDLLNSALVQEFLPRFLNAEDIVVFTSAITPDRGKDENAAMKNINMAYNSANIFAASSLSQFIYVSSDAVYPDDLTPLREDSPSAASGLYGTGHKMRELIFKECLARTKTPLTVVRPCAIFGSSDTHNSYGPNRFMRSAMSGDKITLFGGGEEKRPHLFVKDFCRILELIMIWKSSNEQS